MAKNFKKLTRTQLFEKLGAPLTNRVWSWCSIHPERRFAVFAIWKDKIENGRTRLTPLDPKVQARLGAKEQERVIDESTRNNIPAFGVVCTVKDPQADPRSIKDIDTENLVRLTLKRVDGIAYAIHGEKTYVADVLRIANDSAISDIVAPPVGEGYVDRAASLVYSFKRDSKVRNHVINRANGKCEYCGEEGFLTPNGKHYLEAHHIIALSEQGPDSINNVIGLCPEHHRQAHYGADAENLEKDFVKILARMN